MKTSRKLTYGNYKEYCDNCRGYHTKRLIPPIRIWVNDQQQLHKEDGPALIRDNKREWYQNGKLHRENGPAVEHTDGQCEYYINHHWISKDEWKRQVKELKAERKRYKQRLEITHKNRKRRLAHKINYNYDKIMITNSI